MSERGQGAGLPGSQQGIPGLPEGFQPIAFEGFEGLNTKPLRPGIKDQEMAWCDGWMPLGPNNLRTLYGIGSALYTAPTGLAIIFHAFGNISSTAYAYALLSDGSVQQIQVSNGSITQVMQPGTILSPTSIFGFSQWGSKYIIFAANQENGYWLWDGTALYTAGTIGPVVTLSNSGLNYTSNPTVTLTTTGSGTGVTFAPLVQNGSVTQILVTNPGSGFQINDLTLLTITGGGSDNQASAAANISTTTGIVTSVTVTNTGHTYDGLSYVSATGGGASKQATFAVSSQSGSITGVTPITPGVGYTSPPTLTATGPSGSGGFAGVANLSFGVINSISITNGGSGYKSAPTVTILGDGQNAQGTAIVNNSGQVTSVNITNGGFGYTKALVQFSGGNNAASASVALMPYGISGTTVETYEDRVWVGSISNNIPKGFFSAPEDPGDFGSPTGGGIFPSNDSFLRYAYQRFIQSNGFLYLLADSSINYISGVNSAGSPVQTTFSNLNVDPQIGTPWPGSVQVFSRNIIFANSFGVHVSYGGAVTKISQPLDGIYNTVLTQQGTGAPSGFYPSGAVASLFGIQVYMLLLPIIDAYTGQQVNKLLMYDGKKWWTSPQDIPLTYISTQEINSVLTAWGTDGSGLYPLFQKPTLLFPKVVQSKLWSNPSYLFEKTATHIAGIANFYSEPGEVDVSVDNEAGASTAEAIFTSTTITWFNDSGGIITWINNASQPIVWGGPGLTLLGPQLANESGTPSGTLLGLTISTSVADMALLSMITVEQVYQPKL